jgi:hypothetical protein
MTSLARKSPIDQRPAQERQLQYTPDILSVVTKVRCTAHSGPPTKSLRYSSRKVSKRTQTYRCRPCSERRRCRNCCRSRPPICTHTSGHKRSLGLDYRMASFPANRVFQVDISERQSCPTSHVSNRGPLLIGVAKGVSQWEAVL